MSERRIGYMAEMFIYDMLCLERQYGKLGSDSKREHSVEETTGNGAKEIPVATD
jgi:hypothetical protein